MADPTKRQRLRGVFALTMDAKGRMAIPTRYRSVLSDWCENQLVVTIDTDEKCLLVYPLPEWEKIEEKLEALPSFNAAARRIQRLLVGHATDIEVDSNGRMLLSQPLRDYAELGKKLVLLGQGNKFELWDEELWNSRREAYIDEEADNSALPDDLMQLSL